MAETNVNDRKAKYTAFQAICLIMLCLLHIENRCAW